MIIKNYYIDYEVNSMLINTWSNFTIIFVIWSFYIVILFNAEIFQDEKQHIVSQINTIREQVVPPAANMLLIDYDEIIGKQAQRRAESCNLEIINSLNLMREINSDERINPLSAIQNWAFEKRFFPDKCAHWKCYNYSNLIYAKSNKVGCGQSICRTAKGNMLSIVTCYFNPPLYQIPSDGKAPFEHLSLYEEGTKCSKCPDYASRCVNNLCSTGSSDRLMSLSIFLLIFECSIIYFYTTSEIV